MLGLYFHAEETRNPGTNSGLLESHWELSAKRQMPQTKRLYHKAKGQNNKK